MAEVYSALEAYIYRVGSKAGDSTETAIDAYAEGVDVKLSRALRARTDTSGVVQQRIPLGKEAEMRISRLYSDDPHLCDGNNLKLYFMNSLGTQTYQLTGAYWSNKGWRGDGDDPVNYDVTIVGRDFGTV